MERHPAAGSPLAKAMVERLRGDMALFEGRSASRPKPTLLGFAPAEVAALVSGGGGGGGSTSAAERVSALLAALAAQGQADAAKAAAAQRIALSMAGDAAINHRSFGGDADGVGAFSLRQVAGFAPRSGFELLVSFLLSSKGSEDLLRLNPYLTPDFIVGNILRARKRGWLCWVEGGGERYHSITMSFRSRHPLPLLRCAWST